MQTIQLLHRIKSDCLDHHIQAITALKIWEEALANHLSVSLESQHYDRMAEAQAELEADMNFVLDCNCCNNQG